MDFSKDFFQRIKNIIKSQFLLRQDNVDDLSSLSMYKLSGSKKIFTPTEEARQINKIKYEDLVKVKKGILSRDNCYTIRIK